MACVVLHVGTSDKQGCLYHLPKIRLVRLLKQVPAAEPNMLSMNFTLLVPPG